MSSLGSDRHAPALSPARHTAGILSLILFAAAVAPRVTNAQAWRPPPKPDTTAQQRANPAFLRYRTLPASLASARARRAIPAVVVGEAEPNNTAGSATIVALFDTVSGTIGYQDDIDFFAIDLTAGTALDLDIDAAAIGSPLDPVIGLFDTDGETLIIYNDDFDGLDSRIWYVIPADGRYYVAVVGYAPTGGPDYVYALSFGTIDPDETEPNGTPATANDVTPGEPLIGLIDPASDVDYFAIDLNDGALLEARVSSAFFAHLVVYGTDGTTVIDSSAAFGDSPLVVRAYTPAGGRYYLAVSQQLGSGSSGGVYGLATEILPTGPGDPTTLFAPGFLSPTAMAVDHDGTVLVADAYAGGIFRVGQNGSVSSFVTNVAAYGLAIDGFGNLLASGYDYNGGPGVFRFTPAGERSVFAADDLYPTGPITVGPDGDVWIADCSSVCYRLVRFDPFGSRKSDLDVTFGVPIALAFSPAGVLHMTVDSTVYRIDGTAVHVAVRSRPFLEGLAFDEDGFLYVANGYLGKVLLFDADYHVVDDPFAATHLGGPLTLAFGRDGTGAMTKQLLATNGGFNLRPPYGGGIVAMNPAGIRAPGYPVGVDLVRIASAELRTGTVGAEYADTLTPDDEVTDPVWSLTAGELPAGLALDSATGIISGVPRANGTFSFAARLDDAERFGFGVFSLTIGEPDVTTTNAIDAALGVPGVLTPELERYFDIQGNQNGTFDIGDVRAYLRRKGELPTTTVTTAREGGAER